MTLRLRGESFGYCWAPATGLFAVKLKNGAAGVEKFEELKPDVVVLDLAMPDMDGLEAAQWMSTSDPTVPIILFTILGIEGIRSSTTKAEFGQSCQRTMPGA